MPSQPDRHTAEELLGNNCRLLQGKATSGMAVAQIRAAIAEQRETTIEILNYKNDGKQCGYQLHLSRIYDGHGELAYYFASQVDVTGYRRIQTLEEAEHRILLEVDRRTKNVLAIVDSVVRLSKSDDAAAYAGRPSYNRTVGISSRLKHRLKDRHMSNEYRDVKFLTGCPRRRWTSEQKLDH